MRTILLVLVGVLSAGCPRRGGGHDRVVDGGPDPEECEERGDGRDGWPCGCTADCAPGAVCLTEAASGAPGGQCVRQCQVGGEAACEEGARCEPLTDDGDEGACLATCTTTDDCPPRGYCDYGGLCVSFCFADEDCDGGVCDEYSGLCTDAPATEGLGIWEACLRDEDCRSGNCGSSGRCLTTCLVSEQNCPDGAVCFPNIDGIDLGACVLGCDGGACPDAGLGCRASEVGDVCLVVGDDCRGPVDGVPDAGSCGCDEDCRTGDQCLSEASVGQPGGFCAHECDEATPCEDGWDCQGTLCYERCEDESECGPGRICDLFDGFCYGHCDGDTECVGGVCNPYGHLCGPVPEAGAGQAEPCVADEDCRSGLCTGVDGGPGFCTGRCRVSTQDCPDGAYCISDEPYNDSGLCAPRCTDDSDCPDGSTCWDTVEPEGGARHCF